MNKSLIMRTLCLKSILPAAAALVFAATGGSAFGQAPTQQDAASRIEAKLQPAYIPTLKAGTTVAKAKAADLITALSLAAQDPLNSAFPSDILATGAFLAEPKVRADKDKVAAQVIATVAAARNLDAAGLGAVTAAVFNVNSTTNRLTAAGQAAAVIGGLKAATSASEGAVIGTDVANALGSTDLATLLANTVKGLGKTTTLAQGATLANFVSGVFGVKGTAVANETFVKGVADKVAATNVIGTGALYGGLVLDNPNGAYTGDDKIKTLLSNIVTTDTKVTKALGEIVADTTGAVADRAALSTALNALTIKNKAIPDTTKALLTQGLLRSAADSTEVNAIITGAGTLDPTKYGAALITGTTDGSKANAIAANLSGKVAADIKKQEALGVALINALGLSNPAAAEQAANAILANTVFSSATAKQQFGLDTMAKYKTFAAAGYVAASIVSANATSSGTAATTAAALMAKGTKAATDIAQQVAALSIAGADKAAFADTLAGNALKFVQNVAVGVSLADPSDAGQITLKSITHGGVGDKTSIAKAATIAAAVANVVDVEQTAEIAKDLATVMTLTGGPLKLTVAGTLATGLAKAIQAKPGVTNANRMDELGELAAALTSGVLGKSGADSKGQTAEQKLITTIGSNILKALNKVPALSGNPNTTAAAALVTNTQTSKADLWEARDIAGSIAETIKGASTTVISDAQKTTLLGTPSSGSTGHSQGLLEKAFIKLAGTKTSATVAAVIQAFDDVLHGNDLMPDGVTTKFETGSDLDPETDHKNG